MTDERLGRFAALGDRAKFFKGLFEGTSGMRKAGTRTVAGVRCVGLEQGGAVLWVDTVTARPQRLDAPARSNDVGAVSFSEYYAVPNPKAPPRATVIDSSKLR